MVDDPRLVVLRRVVVVLLLGGLLFAEVFLLEAGNRYCELWWNSPHQQLNPFDPHPLN